MSNEEILEQTETAADVSEVEQVTDESPQDEAASVNELKQKLEAAEKKAADNWDQLLRARAEMDNIRRRTQKDLENAHKYGLEKFVTELIAVKDSLELGLDAAKQDTASVDALVEGTELTLNMLKSVFEKFNIAELHPQDEKFNPEHHQAMSMQEHAEAEPNTVLAVMQKGYLLNDRLVRPAMVLVSKKPAE
ncbi:MAG: nucleotide exchange factor GrpE [Gammaproteobacteria bacterium]|nr:nucleotide exchange factor GrpE [Gammaproteobacteria bacterium]